MEKQEFTKEMAKLLKLGKPNLVDCDYVTNKNTGEEKVIITCENGYTYKVDVSCDSLHAMVIDVWRAMQSK